MARYQNGTIRPSLPESVSDSLRGVRSGYLVAGGVPVTGNYVDAIRDGLRGGFGPPPVPSVGYAATAEYVYPSQKMVTGAALAGAQLRAALAQPSYSSPAAEYHRGLRSLRGLGASSTFTVQSGMNATQAVQAMNAACGGPYGLADLLAATGASSATSVPAGTFACPGTSGADTGAGAGAAGDTGTLPDDLAQVLLSLQREGTIDGDDVTDYANRLVSGEAEALIAYKSAPQEKRNAYKACVRDEAAKGWYLPTDFSNCRDLVGVAAARTWWDALKEAAEGVGAIGAEGLKAGIDAGIQRLQSAGKQVPSACSSNKYTAGCAAAVATAITALDRETGGGIIPTYTPPSSSSDNTGLFIGLGVGAIVLVGVVALMMSKKQPAA